MLAPEPLNGTSLEIVELVEEDARRSLADIGRRVSLSPPAVKRRMDRVGALGVITGYTMTTNHAKLGRPSEAFAELRLAGTTTVDDSSILAKGLAEVHAVFTTAGDPDALMWVDVDDHKCVIDQIRRTRKVAGTKTLTVLGTWSPRSTGRRGPRATTTHPGPDSGSATSRTSKTLASS
jgi:Lrp/AsnC family leucine-responsive transcriptional regulator